MTPILQSEAGECALASLAMVASFYGQQIDLSDLRNRFPVSLKGATLDKVINYAAAMNFDARPLGLELSELNQLQLPCILHWDLNHFVVLSKVDTKSINILDPALGERKLLMSEIGVHFTGVALELTPTAAFQAVDERRKLSMRSLMGHVIGLKRSLLQIFAVAIVLEAFALAAPFLNQLVVDEAIATHDKELLTIIALGFTLLLVVQTLVGLARSWMVMVLSQNLNLQWATNVFSHLVKLPVEYFEKRHTGDVLSRFGSVASIQQTLTTSVVEVFLDGVMAIAALVMMCLYSIVLTVVVVVSALLYGVMRMVFYSPFRAATAERLIVSAREQTHFLETVRAISPIKLFGREQERRARWQNLMVEVMNRDLRTAKMLLAFGTTKNFLFGIENILVIWLGAGLIMTSTSSGSPAFTIGMLFAFLTFKGQFTGRIAALINYAVDFKMLGLHADRLSDIVLSTPEINDKPDSDLAHLPASIELCGVSFRYGEGEPWIIRNASLTIPAGQNIAIVGPSGCGKTTLLKILLGLLHPQEGEVLYGGSPVKRLGLQNFRKRIGTVMQEDVLMTGTIMDNITFFDVKGDPAFVVDCARRAFIHDEITAMPVGYQSLVGDMGSSLSGGQRQRVLLARALYKRPSVLALDEATSHLDVANERRVVSSLADLNLTTIVVAHRPETIASAQRVVSLCGGNLQDRVFN